MDPVSFRPIDDTSPIIPANPSLPFDTIYPDREKVLERMAFAVKTHKLYEKTVRFIMLLCFIMDIICVFVKRYYLLFIFFFFFFFFFLKVFNVAVLGFEILENEKKVRVRMQCYYGEDLKKVECVCCREVASEWGAKEFCYDFKELHIRTGFFFIFLFSLFFQYIFLFFPFFLLLLSFFLSSPSPTFFKTYY